MVMFLEGPNQQWSTSWGQWLKLCAGEWVKLPMFELNSIFWKFLEPTALANSAAPLICSFIFLSLFSSASKCQLNTQTVQRNYALTQGPELLKSLLCIANLISCMFCSYNEMEQAWSHSQPICWFTCMFVRNNFGKYLWFNFDETQGNYGSFYICLLAHYSACLFIHMSQAN